MAVGTDDQKERFGKLWCAMAITQPGAGSDTANISTVARRDGDEEHLLEKFARDSKVLDIFEGTQRIQELIVARHVIGLTSTQLK